MKRIVRKYKSIKSFKTDLHALYLVYRDQRLPWSAKLLVACVVAYILSPFDLIPDFISILGQIDDAFLIPLGIGLVIRLVPKEIMEEYRLKAQNQGERGKSKSWTAFGVIVLILLLVVIFLARQVSAK